MNDIEAMKKYGILWPVSELKKSIGIKYYLIFWKRKYYMQKEILRRVENDRASNRMDSSVINYNFGSVVFRSNIR